ncbi:hypothetical protein ACGFIW_17335 [Micromonospora sp. NPDC048935]|uniref:hypothetical protein n=1 Tax=Micromonospora sp. NPDC048935 TaxID=3364262 RepID=UPI003719FEB0
MKDLPLRAAATNVCPRSAKAFADHCGGNFPRDFQRPTPSFPDGVGRFFAVVPRGWRETLN